MKDLGIGASPGFLKAYVAQEGGRGAASWFISTVTCKVFAYQLHKVIGLPLSECCLPDHVPAVNVQEAAVQVAASGIPAWTWQVRLFRKPAWQYFLADNYFCSSRLEGRVVELTLVAETHTHFAIHQVVRLQLQLRRH
jgi:hypothetical protein